MAEQGRGFKAAQRKMTSGKSLMTGILEQDGTISTSRDRIIGRAFEYYRDLYSSNTTFAPSYGSRRSVPEIIPSEVEIAIKQCKRGKACGPDAIGNEVLKLAGEPIYGALAGLFNRCLQEREIPNDWNDAAVILLYKKDISNYRPISLLSCLYKIFTKILTRRITIKS